MFQLLTGVLLAGLGGAGLWRQLAGRNAGGPRAADFLPLGAVAAATAYVPACAARAPLGLLFGGPALLATGLLFLLTLPRLVTGRPAREGPARRGLRRALAAVGLLAFAFSAVRTLQWERRRGEYASFAAPLRAETRVFDHTEADWSTAFRALLERLETEYPFTEWKGVDWAALRAEFTPRVAAAEAARDSRAYYKAVRELAWRIPDGHVNLAGDDAGLRRAEVGGSLGLELAELTDGRIVAGRVTPGGPAERAGVGAGAEVLAWGGLPVQVAVARAPYTWSDVPPATAAGRRRSQLRLLPRAPVGSSVSIRWRNPGGPVDERALVAAEAPEPSGGSRARDLLFGCAVEWRPPEGGLGYVRVGHEIPTPRCVAPEEELARALAAFQKAGVSGLVLDLRGNFGGEDATAARLAGFFVEAEEVYERVGLFEPRDRSFRIPPEAELRIRPARPRWTEPLVLLVDGDTVSSGEGLPLVLKGRPGVTVVGFEPTHGSFAINQKEVRLPGGLTFTFPQARSLDAAGRIQVDSDASGRGGIEPDLRVARDLGVLESERDGRDVLLERARAVLAAR